MFQKTLEGSYSLNDKRFKQVSDKAKDLITQLLETEPDERISLDDALKHEWFKQQDPIMTGAHSIK